MAAFKENIHETSTTTGTGDFTLSAVSGRSRFSDSDKFGTTSNTNVFNYYISHNSADEYERGYAHMSATNTLVRDTVIENSLGTTAKINFTSGTKDVTCDMFVEEVIHPGIANVRLTFESGVAVSTSDQTAVTTVYATPYKGNRIALYDGDSWVMYVFSELSISLSGWTTGKPNDIFCDYNDGSPQIARTEWTNDTTRATALVLQDGVYVKSGDTQQRYLGTIYTSATGQTQIKFGSLASGGGEAWIGLWNMYNRVRWSAKVQDTTNTVAYATAAWRSALNSNTNRITVVVGLDEDPVEVSYSAIGYTSQATGRAGVGLDVTNNFSGSIGGLATGSAHHFEGAFNNLVGIGKHFLQAVEYGGTGVTFGGDFGAPSNWQMTFFGHGMY